MVPRVDIRVPLLGFRDLTEEEARSRGDAYAAVAAAEGTVILSEGGGGEEEGGTISGVVASGLDIDRSTAAGRARCATVLASGLWHIAGQRLEEEQREQNQAQQALQRSSPAGHAGTSSSTTGSDSPSGPGGMMRFDYYECVCALPSRRTTSAITKAVMASGK